MNIKSTFRATIAISLTATMMAGCATRPSDISAAYVSDSGYRTMSCAQLEQEAQVVSARAVEATNAQERQASNDAMAVTAAAIVFWPAVFLARGDGASAAEVSRLKGEMQAIETVSRQKGCNIVFQQA